MVLRQQSKQKVHKSEYWQQDSIDPNLWHGPHGVMINTAALHERQAYFSVVLIKRCDFVAPLYQPLQGHLERLHPLF